jgi:hypothetical protein
MSRVLTSTITLAVLLGTATAARAQSAEQCFLGATESRYGDGARIEGNVGTNQLGGILHLGRRSVIEVASVASADTIRLGNGSQIAAVAANVLEKSRASVGQEGAVELPLVDAFCPVPALVCGDQDVVVRKNKTESLPPGSYGAVVLQNGADLVLEPGTYEFCSLRGGRKASIVTSGETVLNVQGTFELGNGSKVRPPGRGPLVLINVGGSAKLGAKSTVAAALAAPARRLQLGRGVEWRGRFCASTIAGGPRLKLDCDVAPPTTTTTTSTSTTSTTTSSTTTSSTTTTLPTTTFTTTTTSTTSSTSSTTTSSSTTSTVPTTTTAPPTNTTTSSTTTTSTTAPTTTTTTTPTTTTTTTLPGPLTCGPSNFLDVTATLVYEPRIVGGVFGMFLEVDYSAPVTIPGSGTAASARARFTNLIGANYRLVPQDLDSNSDGTDDRGRALVTANTSVEIPGAAIERVRFDCPSGTVVQPAQFACRPTDLSDSAGMLFPAEVAALVSCSLNFEVP